MTSGGGETGFNAGPGTFATEVKAGGSVLLFIFTLYGCQACKSTYRFIPLTPDLAVERTYV